MPITDWDAEISAEERDTLIDTFAKKVDERGLHVPAILFLEMHKPFTFLASQSLILGSGFLAPLFGADKVQRYAKLIESRGNVELMIRRIEEMQVSRQQKA
ncbi:hypothetical protein LBMAG21_06210 [Armatimonadota bacterium]|nr:hypothetical protein LBMAG21_06210 [Armatimonadota bacterium]